MAAPSDIDSDKLLQLTRGLQTTLDVEALLGIFSKHLSELLGLRGIRYANEQVGVDLSLGKSTLHRVEYPLDLAEEALGELALFSARALTTPQRKTAEVFIEHLLHPLRNALMYREAVNASARDPLTGVNNRSRFHNVLVREVEMSRRHGVPLSLIMLDVDRFKSINDKHGHMVGDMALKSIANCMLGCIRESDILFRYGGEEFCIALASTGLAGARKLAERVRSALEILVVRTSTTRLHVTASFGVATLEDNDDATHLVEKADHSLYRAKELGRNRIATHEDTRGRSATD